MPGNERQQVTGQVIRGLLWFALAFALMVCASRAHSLALLLAGLASLVGSALEVNKWSYALRIRFVTPMCLIGGPGGIADWLRSGNRHSLVFGVLFIAAGISCLLVLREERKANRE